VSETKVEPGNTLGDNGIRLYICSDCKQIIPIHSPEPDRYSQDFLLHRIEEDHGFRGHRFAVVTVNKSGWEDETQQKDIIKQIQAAVAGGETGLGSEFYDVKDTFVDDAQACFKAHLRNANCSDYKSNEKRLSPQTAAERKAAGLPEYRTNNDVYLCQFCPVHSLVVTAARKRAGLYN
jgi:hypothetical protein